VDCSSDTPDHKQKCFKVNTERTIKVPAASRRRLIGDSLIKDSIHDLESFNLNNPEEIDRLADKFKTTFLNAYEAKASCPIVHQKVKKDVPWWPSRNVTVEYSDSKVTLKLL
jgi:hypothetical protein